MSSSQPPRIFLIGFNKCGTTSFHDYFKANGITSVHWRANTLAMALHRNQLAGQPLLSGIEDWTAYTDMICIPGTPWERSNSDGMPLIEGCRLFRELHQAYPEALFILNTRDPMQWVRSRLKHDQGRLLRPTSRRCNPRASATSANCSVAGWRTGTPTMPRCCVISMHMVGSSFCCSTSARHPWVSSTDSWNAISS